MSEKRILALAIVALCGSACRTRNPVHLVLPESFRGFARLEVEQPSCPPIPQREGVFVVELDENGRGCTSSAFPVGRANKDRALLGGTEYPIVAQPAASFGVRGYWTSTHTERESQPRHYVCVFVGSGNDLARLEEGCTPEE
jgi:hypothetical protein